MNYNPRKMQKVSKIILFIFCLLQTPKLSFCQSNELYNLLGWNTKEEQKKLIVWYDIQDESKVKWSKNNTKRVAALVDKSSRGNNIFQSNDQFQPVLFDDNNWLSGPKKGISFANGGYMVLEFPKTNSLSEITSFVVCKNELGGSRLLYDLSLQRGEGVASCYSGLYEIESRVPNSLASFIPNFENNPNKYLIISTRGEIGNIESFLNNEKYSGAGKRNFAGSSYDQLRLSTNLGVAPSNGALYELILFDKKLSDEEFYKVKDYLENKYIFDETFLAKKQQNIAQLPKEIIGNSYTIASEQQNSSLANPEFETNSNSTTLGEQIWMTKNLDVVNFQNGDSIPQALNKEEWIKFLVEGKPAWCYFNFLDKKYGKIYNFHAIVDDRGLTPKGWKIPSDDDIETLSKFLGAYAGSSKSVDFESIVAQNEIIDNIKGTNKLGFNLHNSAYVVYGQSTLKDVDFVPLATFWSFTRPFTDEAINIYQQMLKSNQLDSNALKIKYKEKALGTYFKNSSTGVIVGMNQVNMYYIGCPVRCIKTTEYDLQFPDGRVSSNGKWGLINKRGDILLALVYDDIGEFKDGFAIVKLNSKYGMINLQGEQIIKPLYDNSFQFIDKVATVSLNGRVLKIDKYGKEIINSKSNSSVSSIIEGKSVNVNSKLPNEISYVRLGEIDVLTSDLGEMTYVDAKNAIKNLGEGWRLPNEKELKLMFNSQDKIGALSKREYKIVQDYWIYGGNYLGEEANGQLVLLRTLIDPGYTITFNKSDVDKRSLKYIRAVREVPSTSRSTASNKTKSNDIELSDLIAATILSDNLIGNVIKDAVTGMYDEPKRTTNNSTSATAKKSCGKCSKGFNLIDYDDYTRRYSNSRREVRIGFVLCGMCQGTKKMSVTAGSDYIGRGCTSCQNTGWIKCDMSSSGH